MSVVVITKFPGGTAAALERLVAGEHAQTMIRIGEEAKSKGALHHLFVEDTDGGVFVIDQWESEAAFQAFFANQADIPQVAAAAGVNGPPTSTAYRILDTPDRF